MDDPRASAELSRRVGHPGELFQTIQTSIQLSNATRFSEVLDDWLALMWSIDAFRVAGVVPQGMGDPKVEPADRLAAIARSKGNWFGTVISLLLQNRTGQVIRPRMRVEGFSQTHQIDLAWPERRVDPRVCIETKVTGGPAYGKRPARGAMSDWTNRRKELKFAATDLRLYRRQDGTTIRHWGVWRRSAPPRTYFLWGARLRAGTTTRQRDSAEKMVVELRALTDTYLDGAGVISWQTNEQENGYRPVFLPRAATFATVDDVLQQIESEIENLVNEDGSAPPPVLPSARTVEIEELEPDEPNAE